MNTVRRVCHELNYSVKGAVTIDGVFYLYVITDVDGNEYRFQLKKDLRHFIYERSGRRC